jgi:hypothetical protein
MTMTWFRVLAIVVLSAAVPPLRAAHYDARNLYLDQAASSTRLGSRLAEKLWRSARLEQEPDIRRNDGRVKTHEGSGGGGGVEQPTTNRHRRQTEEEEAVQGREEFADIQDVASPRKLEAIESIDKQELGVIEAIAAQVTADEEDQLLIEARQMSISEEILAQIDFSDPDARDRQIHQRWRAFCSPKTA